MNRCLKDSFNEIQHLQKEFRNLDISEKEIYTRPESGFSLDSGVSDIEINDNFDLKVQVVCIFLTLGIKMFIVLQQICVKLFIISSLPNYEC